MRFRPDKRAGVTLLLALAGAIWLALNASVELWSPPRLYRQVTGYLLLAIFAALWVLPVVRQRMGSAPGRQRVWHEVLGAAMVAGVVLHAVNVPTVFLAVIAALMLAMAMLGAAHPGFVTPRTPSHLRVWWIAHIVLVGVGTALSLIHVWVMWTH